MRYLIRVLMIVVTILGVVGFYGFGATFHYQTNWFGPVARYGLANMSLAFASTCVFGYVLVSHAAFMTLRSLLTVRTGLLSKAGRRSVRRNQYTQHLDFRIGKLQKPRLCGKRTNIVRPISSTPGS